MSPTLKRCPATKGCEARCASSRLRYLAPPALAPASTSGASGCCVQFGDARVDRWGCRLSEAQSDHCQAKARSSGVLPPRSEPAMSIKYEKIARDSARLKSPEESAGT